MNDRDIDTEICDFITGVQTIPRDKPWQLISPIVFDKSIDSPSGSALAIVNFIGTYSDRKLALQEAEELIQKYPGRLFSVVPSHEWYPICPTYRQVDLLPLDKKGKITEFTKNYIRGQRESMAKEKIRDKILDQESKNSEDKTRIEFYVSQTYQATLRRQQIEACIKQLQLNEQEMRTFADDYNGNLTQDLDQHLEQRLALTDELHLKSDLMREHYKTSKQ